MPNFRLSTLDLRLSTKIISPKLWLFFIALCLSIAAGCSAEENKSDAPRALHPSLEFIESSTEIRLERVMPQNDDQLPVFEPPKGSSPSEISALIAGLNNEFEGSMTQAVQTDSGLVLIDSDRDQVFYMDADSTLHKVGRTGPGPGEYSFPAGIAYAGNSRVIVADVMKVETFQLSETSVEPEKTISTGIDTPSGICVMNDIIYASGIGLAIDDDALMALMQGEPAENLHSFISRPVHSFTMDGSSIRTFGNRYASQTGWPTFTSYFSAQYILCDEERNQVYTVNQKFPIVSAWSGEGEELWTVFLEDIPSLPMNERNEGMPEMYLSEGAQTFYSSARPVMLNGELMLQFSKEMLDKNHEFIEKDESIDSNYDLRYIFMDPEAGEINRIKKGTRVMLNLR